MAMYGKMILPTDGSDLSFIGVDEGLKVAKTLDIPVVAIHVLRPTRYTPGLMEYGLADAAIETQELIVEGFEKRGKEILKKVKQKAYALGVEIETKSVDGVPYDEITKISDDNDIIYISSHGHSGWSSLFLGSTTDRVLKHTKSTVAVVRSKDE